LVLLHRSEKIELFHKLLTKRIVDDVIIPTLPNVGNGPVAVCVEEK